MVLPLGVTQAGVSSAGRSSRYVLRPARAAAKSAGLCWGLDERQLAVLDKLTPAPIHPR